MKKLQLHKLSYNGFLFIWVKPNELHHGIQLLSHWGYSLVDQLTWIKTTSNQTILCKWDKNNSKDRVFVDSHQICIVGLKNLSKLGKGITFKISNDLIVESEQIQQNEKPIKFYLIVQKMVPKSLKLELFANQARQGWVTIKNEPYNYFQNKQQCGICERTFDIQREASYKSKYQQGQTVCQDCYCSLVQPDELFKSKERNLIDLLVDKDWKNTLINQSEEIIPQNQNKVLNLAEYFRIPALQNLEEMNQKFQCNQCRANSKFYFSDKRFTQVLCEDCFDTKLDQIQKQNFIIIYEEISLGTHNCTSGIQKIQIFQQLILDNTEKEEKIIQARLPRVRPIDNEILCPKTVKYCEKCKQKLKDEYHYACQQCFAFQICHGCYSSCFGMSKNHNSNHFHSPNHQFNMITTEVVMENCKIKQSRKSGRYNSSKPKKKVSK